MSILSARPCKHWLCALLVLALSACTTAPERDAETEKRDILNQQTMHRSTLNSATSHPSDETLFLWLRTLEDNDVTVFSRAKAQLLPHRDRVAQFARDHWLVRKVGSEKFEPKSDDALQSIVEMLIKADLPGIEWRRALRKEILSWFEESRKSLLLVRGLDWFVALEEKTSSQSLDTLIRLLGDKSAEVRWKSAALLEERREFLSKAQLLEVIVWLKSPNVEIRRDAGGLIVSIVAGFATEEIELKDRRLTFNPIASSATRATQIRALDRWVDQRPN